MALTTEEIKQALPAKLRSSATDDFTNLVNSITTDQIVAERIRENFVSFTSVLNEGKFSTKDYLNAVTYVTYKHMGLTNMDSYIKTFPDRYAALVAKKAPQKDIAAYVYAFSRTKLVVSLLEQTLVPMWIVNQDVYQRAINTQAQLMMTAQSEKVRCDAANSILTHLAKPKDAVTNINLDLRENSDIRDLQNTLRDLAQQQQQLIESGMSTRTITESNLVRQTDATD